MEKHTAAQPSPLLAKLAKPTSAYKRQAWLAMAGLVVFMLLYFALAGWFLLTAYRLTLGAGAGGKDAFWGWIVAACALFLAVFMLKAVFFVKHGKTDDSVEVTPQDQPELFRFLHALADKAGAPRPHRVFLSPRVNAAVFYDLSLLNLFFPSKKNLEIGLGLVNTLTLGEFRAVLAHEFGHFAQRAMAVGRWVYVAQQIAGHLVARRDKLDDFLGALSRFDFRIAWVGWLLSLVVWSIRSLVDSVFQVVVLMQRALSREMEMNADLVAVALTGSDALIHALHRLQAADDAWARAANFVMGEKSQGRITPDMFEIQTQVISHMGQLLNDADYGHPPPIAGLKPEAHRVFKAELAQPPQMWLTHPLNHEREANAKRRYVQAPIDDRTAWVLFADVLRLRVQVTAKLLEVEPPADLKSDEALAALNVQFGREFLKSRYRGVYFGRSAVRHASDVAALYEPVALPSVAVLDALYPESLAADMEQLRAVEKELAQLQALESGALKPPGGEIRHRRKALRRKELPAAIKAVQREFDALQGRLQAHDRHCRSVHRALAASFGGGWREHLQGLLAALHYAEHTEANLRDLQGLLGNTVAIVTATRRVSSSGIDRLVKEGNVLHAALAQVFGHASRVQLDEMLLERLEIKAWTELVDTLQLPGVAKENLGDWLKVVDSWVDQAAGACARLGLHAREQLLKTEALLADHLRHGTRPGPAPAASRVPEPYATLVAGAERKRQTQLDLWSRFQLADGWLPGVARLGAAGGIVVAVLGFGSTVGQGSVTIYNGLGRPVVVRLGQAPAVTVAPHQSLQQAVEPLAQLPVESSTVQGQLIERFEADASSSFGQFIYNVASAAPLVEWTAVYGNTPPRPERLLGLPRWSSSSADVLFAEPPRSISTKGGGGQRTVLSGLGQEVPLNQLGALSNEADHERLALVHARWDDLDARSTGHWLMLAQHAAGFPKLIAQRLAESPDNVILLRLELDGAGDAGREAVCARHRSAAQAQPQNVNLQYVVIRCLPKEAARDQAFVDGHARHPEHGWFAYAAGYVLSEQGQWREALAAYEVVRRKTPTLVESVNIDAARIHRLLGTDRPPVMNELVKGSEGLRRLRALETDEGLGDSPYRAYPELARGNLAPALKLAQPQPKLAVRVLRLAAASDGAGPELAERALALPIDQGVDDGTVWSALALAARSGRDVSGYEPLVRRASPAQHATLLRFVDALKKGVPPAQAEALLKGLPPELLGHGYEIGVVMLGAKAPKSWREAAKQLLFVSERPYFG